MVESIYNYGSGSGSGKEILQLALDYAKNTLDAFKDTLGVFANNDSARYCYESVGFKSTRQSENYEMPVANWKCTEMELMIV